MNVAILSDIHSNCYALDAVLSDIKKRNISHLIILGDVFGYYPWAAETYKLLNPFKKNMIAIKGNHDQLLLDQHPPDPVPTYWEAAKRNQDQLMRECPEALTWISKLKFSSEIGIANHHVSLFHGSPDNPENGRFYPTDTTKALSWYPNGGKIILLGHTHYPLIFRTHQNSGIVVNPGSVGQPRDGNPMPSWATWSTTNNSFELMRSSYDNMIVMEELYKMKWDERAIRALNKTQRGELL